MVAESPVRAGETLAGKYRIEEILGVGAMGVVVAAWHLELDQRVAIKFVHEETDERFEAKKRFRREARAAARIRSKHVAHVFDVGTLGDNPYIVMEYLEGNNLAQELRSREPLPVGEAVDYVLQAIDALAELHAMGIVHRDLKPANLFLAAQPDGSRSIKVLDFGISKFHGGESSEMVVLTKAEVVMGSPQYMSPEQLSSPTDIDARADIWSLGAILYKLLTKRAPYHGASFPLLYAAILRDKPQPISIFREDVPPELEAAVARCLTREREQRFATTAELALALRDFGPESAKMYAERAVRVLSAPRPPESFDTTPITSIKVSTTAGIASEHPPSQAPRSAHGLPLSKQRASLLVSAIAIAVSAVLATWLTSRREVQVSEYAARAGAAPPAALPAQPSPTTAPSAESSQPVEPPPPEKPPARESSEPGRKVERWAPRSLVKGPPAPSAAPSPPALHHVSDFGGRR